MRRRIYTSGESVHWPAFVDLLTSLLVVLLLAVNGSKEKAGSIEIKLTKCIGDLNDMNVKYKNCEKERNNAKFEIEGRTEEQFVDQRIAKRLEAALQEKNNTIYGLRASAEERRPKQFSVPIVTNLDLQNGPTPSDIVRDRINGVWSTLFGGNSLATWLSERDLEPKSILVLGSSTHAEMSSAAAYGRALREYISPRAASIYADPPLTVTESYFPRQAGGAVFFLYFEFRLSKDAYGQALKDRKDGRSP